jgi:uncharacterized membrane protein YgcG
MQKRMGTQTCGKGRAAGSQWRASLGLPLLVAALFLLTAAPAQATFHLIKVREVHPGTSDDSYVELQMFAAGQSLLSGHPMTLYSASGSLTHSSTFSSSVPNSANQQTVLIGDTRVQEAFGVAPDLVDSGLTISAAGGAACWNAGGIPADCVAWGNFSGGAALQLATGTTVGSPVSPAGIAAGKAIRRTIEPGCPTLLEAGDDRNVSGLDFFDAAPAPRPNSVAPTEHACAAAGGGGGGSGEGGRGGGEGSGSGGRGGGNPPQTSIRSGPPRVSHRRTATFRFASSQLGSTFLCRLDGRPFAACRAPRTVRHLRPGRHVFKVEARAPGGATDHSPAVWSFRVLAKAR